MIMLSKLSGILIFLSFLVTIFAYFFQNNMIIVAGIFTWIAFLLLFFTLKNKTLIIVLLLLSFLGYIIVLVNNFEINLIKIFTVNQYLLALLIGVGFLRLIAMPKKDKTSSLPKGKKSFIKTYLSVHLFGSVINLSSLILVADKMYKKAPLSKSQIILLTRAFSSDAYWSPFFVAFAAAITYAPKLNSSVIVINGIILAFIAFIITYYDVIKEKAYDIENFYGYPLSFNSLFLPFLLALLVLITNNYFPDLKVIVLISLFSIIMTIIILPIKKGIKTSFKTLTIHITDELPKMKSEISLFLVAGMFGIIIGTILIGLNFTLPFTNFDWKIASLLLLSFIILSFVGIHPIITISIIGDYLSGVNHTFLAVTFLMAWSTTVSTSPFSGLNLTIVARYACSAKEIFMMNISYAIKMYIVCIICLYILSNYFDL
ncbi:tellurium resistance protein TerC [Arcobacter aquimarinus]|uniref:Membrane protein n=1 Tax=Arcobacter aquimarinus TaxID=1315211 RepID=A0AAE7B5G9_9BACT|nr:tellurium resistance protein TerC [Arcobacter aquimarinus]QKE26976.1 putative membrane protein [Arcobacter aquimarinus]RXI36023.1 tellurium resistance protein TerC [Arcobacter aquimarinus]